MYVRARRPRASTCQHQYSIVQCTVQYKYAAGVLEGKNSLVLVENGRRRSWSSRKGGYEHVRASPEHHHHNLLAGDSGDNFAWRFNGELGVTVLGTRSDGLLEAFWWIKMQAALIKSEG